MRINGEKNPKKILLRILILFWGLSLFGEGIEPFYLSEGHKRAANNLIELAGNKSVFYLFFHENKISRELEIVDEVYLHYIIVHVFKRPELKKPIRNIIKNPIKFSYFMNLFRPRLDKSFDEGTLFQEFELICQTLGLCREPIEPFFLARDWDRFILELAKQKGIS